MVVFVFFCIEFLSLYRNLHLRKGFYYSVEMKSLETGAHWCWWSISYLSINAGRGDGICIITQNWQTWRLASVWQTHSLPLLVWLSISCSLSLSLWCSLDKCAKLPLLMLLLINSTATPFPYVVLNFDAMLPTCLRLSLFVFVFYFLCILVASCLLCCFLGICMIHCLLLILCLPWFNVSIVRKMSLRSVWFV